MTVHSMMERFYAICGARGMTKDKSDALLAKHGYNSVREIDLDKFDEICREADAYREE